MKKQTGSRLRLLDTLRGITLISMIVYHAMWDVVYIYGVDFKWYRGNGAYIWQQAICWTFILLSGFCFSLGHSPLRRGLTVLICGTIVSAVTAIVMPSSLVMFGILTLMGSCMLIMIPLDKLFCRVIPEFGAAVRPMFIEAEILSEMDLLDSRIYEMREAVANAAPNDFSSRVWALDNRKLFNHTRTDLNEDPVLF